MLMSPAFNVGKALVEAQDRATHAANLKARESARDALDHTLLTLAQQVERLTLVCEAMWSLIQQRTDLSERDLSQRVKDLDLEDGVRDGKHSKPPVDCPDCGNMVCRKFNRCLFCGYTLPEESVFDTI
jgi:hypothetical protein